MGDPFAALGLTRDATLAEIRAARRRLALAVHPDVGGSAVGMQQLNAAFDAAVAHATGRRRVAETAASAATVSSDPGPASTRPRNDTRVRRTGRRRVEHDAPSFTIDALPVEAFEALLVVASWIGEVAVDDPPYLLEAQLEEPEPCWCRLELVPDAGSTTVSLTVVFDGLARDASDAPITAETVRDTWVSNLNRLGRADG